MVSIIVLNFSDIETLLFSELPTEIYEKATIYPNQSNLIKATDALLAKLANEKTKEPTSL